jgi:glyoxylase-like metal-dependent hydrolase (beta-lactamase superfamily II)/8-oxo-dGTP pyrophosphatase MutT (NUDIX family)
VSTIAQAASVLLARGPGSSQVFIVRRAPQQRFFGGFLVFPGGTVAPEDASPLSPEKGSDPRKSRGLTPFPEAEKTLAVRRVTAARELFEETGVLLARRADSSFLPSSSDLDDCRREMMAGRLPFADVLRRLGLSLRAEDFLPIGDLVTPPFTPLRFDTTFFVARLPACQRAEVWPGELDEGRWTTPADLLSEWTRGECLVSPPTLMLLESIQGRPVEDAPARFAPCVAARHGDGLLAIDFAPAVQMVPLHTIPLPPSTHTNAYLVGSGPIYLLDPGAAEPAEQERLFHLLDAQRARGRKLTAIVLTHHHPDHVGAANACAQRYGLPVWAHPLTARALEGKIAVTRALDDGEHLDLGTPPDGSGPWHLEAIHTPGHAPGHLAFYDPHYRLLFAGDMVSTLTSIVIVPPDGDLAVYIASLKRLRGYDCRLLLPGHGSPSARPGQTIDECLAHRARREEQLLAALSATPRSLADLAAELYRGLPAHLMRLARWQVWAGLQKLEREGRVVPAGDRAEPVWRLEQAT